MDEKRVQELFQQYGQGLEVLVDMLSHMAKRRDMDAIRWLTACFTQAVAEAAKSIKAMDAEN